MWLFYEIENFYNYHNPSANTKNNTNIHPFIFTDYEKMVKFIEWEYATRCKSISPQEYGNHKIMIPTKEELPGKSQHTVYEINYEEEYKGIIMRLSSDTYVCP